MAYTLYRVEQDGTKEVVAFFESQLEIGCLIDDDRKKLDYEAAYEVVSDQVKGEDDGRVFECSN